MAGGGDSSEVEHLHSMRTALDSIPSSSPKGRVAQWLRLSYPDSCSLFGWPSSKVKTWDFLCLLIIQQGCIENLLHTRGRGQHRYGRNTALKSLVGDPSSKTAIAWMLSSMWLCKIAESITNPLRVVRLTVLVMQKLQNI